MRQAGIGTAGARELSMQLGIREPGMHDGPSALFDRVTLHQPMETCTVELLHLNHLVSITISVRARAWHEQSERRTKGA